jgi:hypothetical protein
MHPFQTAVEERDTAAIEAFLAEDVVFFSPNTFKPYPGKAITVALLGAVLRVFEDFRYVRQISDVGGRDHVFVFQARIGDRQVSGCDIVQLDADGKIEEFTVMVRPLSAAKALEEAMGAQMERIKREATEYAERQQARA